MDSAESQIIERIRAAAREGTPLRLRGGGTKDFYGESLQGEILDTRPLSGILSYEPTELVVTARAGTPLRELEAALAEKGQCLPFEPPHFGEGATVGGMVAAGLSGPSRASAGSVRDYVLGLSMVNGNGEALVFGGQVMKNVAGYDVSRLLAGSLGTLGLITAVSLKVLGRPSAEATLKFECGQAESLRMLHAWGGKPLPLNASSWVEDRGVGTLFVRLRGATAAVEAACKAMGGEQMGSAAAGPHWARARELRLPWFEERGGRSLWRLSVAQTAPVLDLPESPLVEWQGAQRWVRAAASDAARIRAEAAKGGGHAMLFIAGDDAAGVPRFDALKPPLDRIQRELKKQFDPRGIFNRGRLHPEY